MAGIRSFRREPVPQRVQEMLRLRYAPAHPHEALRGPILVVDATLTPPKPFTLHRGGELLQFRNLTLQNGVEHPRLRHVSGMRGTRPRVATVAGGDRRDAWLRHPHGLPRPEVDIAWDR